MVLLPCYGQQEKAKPQYLIYFYQEAHGSLL